MLERNSKALAIASLLISAIIIGFSFVVLKTGLRFASPFTLLVDRLLLAFVLLLVLKMIGVLKVQHIAKAQKYRLFWLAQLYPIAFFLFQNFGIKYISASETAIVYSLIPILTTVASALLFKEKTTRIQRGGILLSFGGLLYISIHSFNGFSDNAMGYLLIFCSALSMVFYYVFLKRSVAGISPISITYYLMVYAIAPLLTVYVGWEIFQGKIVFFAERFHDMTYLLSILYLGLLSTLGTSLLTTVGLKRLPATQASIFSNVSPFFGILGGVIFMGDQLQSYQLMGTACILIGVFISLKYAYKS